MTRLKQETRVVQEEQAFISINSEQRERLQSGDLDPAGLGILRSIKVYISISPNDWDDND